MFESMFAAGPTGTDGEATPELGSEWTVENGAAVDDESDVERSLNRSFEGTGADAVLASYLSASTDPIFVVDADGHFVFSNAECRRLFDRRIGELIDDNLFDYDNADNTAMRDVLDSGDPIRGLDQTIETDDGDEFPVERFLYPLFDGEGTLVGGVEINRDVSERVSAQQREEQLEQLRAYQDRVAREFCDWLGRLSDGDYTVDPEVPEPEAEFEDIRNVHDTFETMAADLAAAVRSADEMLSDVRDNAARLDEMSAHLAAGADETMETAREIDEAGRTVATLADDQADRASEAEDAVSELSASIQEITASVQQISAQATRAGEEATEGTVEAERAVERMESALEASERNVGQVAALEEQMSNVEEMADRIEHIAEETNMLALNANIEAARSEAGSDGFAVVAEEIKSLAEESKTTVEEISSTLEGLRDDIEETTATIRESNREIEAGAEAVRAVVDRVETIDTAVQETTEGVEQIADATETQSENAQAVQRIVRDLAEDSHEVDDQMGAVSASVDDQTEYVRQVQDVSGNIEDISTEMRDSVADFTLR